MTENEQDKLAFIYRKVDEVISGERPMGIDREWISSATVHDRLYALELLRWHTYGKERCQADMKMTVEVAQRSSH